MLADYVSGHSVSKISNSYDLHRTTVLEHLKRNGVDRRRHVRKLTNDQVQEASVLYATGISLVDVAAHFDVNEGTIRREFAKAGIAVRPRRGWDSRRSV